MSQFLTEVYLYKDVPFDPDNEHTILWIDGNRAYGTADAKEEQEKYFTQTNKPSRSYNNYSYQRVGTNKIQIKDTYDNVSGHSYMRFRNQAHENKWWYCFITAIDYINENCTEVSYEVDLLQTYQFEWDLKECFIERETVDDDTIGLHTVKEPFETGTKIKTQIYRFGSSSNMALLFTATKKPRIINDNQIAFEDCNGSYSDGNYVAGETFYLPLSSRVEYDKEYTLGSSENKCSNNIEFGGLLLSGLAALGALQSAYIVPRLYLCRTLEDTAIDLDATVLGVYKTPTVLSLTKISREYQNVSISFFDKTLDFDTFNIFFSTRNNPIANLSSTIDKVKENKKYINNKLYTSPYTTLDVFNGVDKTISYAIERFANYPRFLVRFGINGNPEIAIIPDKYCQTNEWYTTDNESDWYVSYNIRVDGGDTSIANIFSNANPDYVLFAKGYPMCATQIDSYAAWLAQNSVSYEYTMSHTLDIGQRMNAFRTKEQAQLQGEVSADKPTNTAGSSLTTSSGYSAPRAFYSTMTDERAELIDGYFSKYGYEVDTIKVPTLYNRERYTYIKTVKCQIEGNFTATVHDKLVSIFDNGVTFWASTHINTIGEYATKGILNPPITKNIANLPSMGDA